MISSECCQAKTEFHKDDFGVFYICSVCHIRCIRKKYENKKVVGINENQNNEHNSITSQPISLATR